MAAGGAKETVGPLGWRNWRAERASRPSEGAFEYPLYTDAHVTGEIATGPYSWINTIAGGFRHSAGQARPGIVLRSEIHLTDDEVMPTNIDWEKTDTKDYLAGDIGDEMAGLGSLALRRRLRSGGLNRRFDGRDSRGVPIEAWHETPRLVGPPPKARSILPDIEGSFLLEDAQDLLNTYPDLTLNNARALARAARSYSLALWVADDDPTQAWLRLVSAIEVAANQAKAAKGLSDAELINLAHPELAETIEQAPDEVADQLRKLLAPTVKATAKFVDFTLDHLPPPPPRRPMWGEVDWGHDAMETALKVIYAHRSNDLHAGVPWPGPLCEVPQTDEAGVATEKLHSFGAAGSGGVWTEEDLPMNLHTFAYITGEVLCHWWAEIGGLASA